MKSNPFSHFITGILRPHSRSQSMFQEQEYNYISSSFLLSYHGASEWLPVSVLEPESLGWYFALWYHTFELYLVHFILTHFKGVPINIGYLSDINKKMNIRLYWPVSIILHEQFIPDIPAHLLSMQSPHDDNNSAHWGANNGTWSRSDVSCGAVFFLKVWVRHCGWVQNFPCTSFQRWHKNRKFSLHFKHYSLMTYHVFFLLLMSI